ncbi:MAG: ATP-binding protein, partial [Pseudomonadota bacterium]
GRQLLDLINNLLDMARLEHGAVVLMPERFCLGTMLSSVVGLQSVAGEAKGIAVHLDAPDLAGAEIEADEMRLRQVLHNLLSNAIKFTSEGEVRLTARLEGAGAADSAGGHPVRLSLAVADTGIGMSAEACQRIFEPYAQADAEIQRQFGGTGLGLSICQRLVDLMEGRIEVESAEGEGSTFRVEVPVLPARAEAPAAVA